MKKIIIAMGFLGLFGGFQSVVFAGYFNTTPINTCNTQITRNLQVGSENDDVYVLQNMLSRAGYLYATPNGYFGQGTKQAVKSFQRDNGLSMTGSVGEATRNAVNERLCDTDVRADSYSYDSYNYSNYTNGYYGYNSGITYVDQYDPYVQVISPQVSTPVVYTNPGNNNLSLSSISATPLSAIPTTPAYYSTNGYQAISTSIPASALIPATTQNQIQSTGLTYNPSTGYAYGVVPQPGTLTVTSPTTNAFYSEGDTVYLSWTSSNLNITQLQILLENTTTGQSKEVAITSGNSFSFVLTKEILDAVCAGACNNNQQGSFRIVIATPMADIAGNISNFRAAVAPVTIRRPYYGYATVTLGSSKTPVNSGEKFKLYVNIPTGSSWDTTYYGNYSIKIHATCPASVKVNIAGVGCGQDFVIPLAPTSFQQEIPSMITNSTWYRQEVVYEIVVSNLKGEVIGKAQTTVISNPAPFSW